MKTAFLARINRWIVFVLFTVVTTSIVFAFVVLINYLRKEEIKRIDLLTSAIKFQQDVVAPDPQVQELLFKITTSNTTIPVIILDREQRPMFHRNIPAEIENNADALTELALSMGRNYPPIELKFPDNNNQFVYYNNSRLLNDLRYSPYILGLFIFSYLVFSYWFLRTIKKTDEGFLWAGLAKETAHQIGTPLSSMIGWVEIMKMENPDSQEAVEIEKDVNRLRTISERFSKIGSVPELNDTNLSETVVQNCEYLRGRISGKIDFHLSVPEHEIMIAHNKILISWVIENIVKNAVDAMKGEGRLDITLYEKGKNIHLDFKDTGCGMTARQTARVFNPGYSTKKRGWGLGLSLAKRVVNEYHRGDLRIAQSEVNVGTTFRVVLRKK